MDDLPGPTPAEGIAAIFALDWLADADADGRVSGEEPVVFCVDNAAVAAKVSTESRRGKFDGVWDALADAAMSYRKSERFTVRHIRSEGNWADEYAVPHEDPMPWIVRLHRGDG